jgi:hypothetical protein
MHENRLAIRPGLRPYAVLVAPYLILAGLSAVVEVGRPIPDLRIPLIPSCVAVGFAVWLLRHRVVLEKERIKVSFGMGRREALLADIEAVTLRGWKVRSGPFIPFGRLYLMSRDRPRRSLAEINVKLFRHRDIRRLLEELRRAGVQIDV